MPALTRRQILLGAAGGWLMRAAGADPAAAPELLAGLEGKVPLIRRSARPPNYETPLAELEAAYTSNRAFFVRYHLAVIPELDPRTWSLQVGGASAQRPYQLTLAQLRREFPPVEVSAVNQCSGNRRGLFSPRVPGVQWTNGAMGNARWRGARLRDVLQRAGIAPDALEVWANGADGPVIPATPDFVKSLPIERALDENSLIAYEMNGAALPHLNGAPARLVVPGWTGTYWMKHLVQLSIEPRACDNFWMKSAYRVPAGAFRGSRFASQDNSDTVPITDILVNSLITSHTDGARVRARARRPLAGKAWDNGAGIAAVEYSLDGRRSWRSARLGPDLGRFAWRGFEVPLGEAPRGALEVAVRARSRDGSQQPDHLTPNPAGYHDNRIQSVRLEVT
ncbi:MAG: molybdopterin-dependent oxidoreductase [Gammaproteobacteria bacterium]|nr:molybdopterin-dependent oxidoreductase [Gammaproteobacteria bacterium]